MRALRLRRGLLGIAHGLDHLLMLVFANAALAISDAWDLTYSALVPWATPAFIIFGLAALPAGWLADRWSREGMLIVFFLGAGASCALTALADTPLQLAIGLGFIALFAAIYHPVGLAMVVEGEARTGFALALNGVWGNLGVAVAALATGALVDVAGWRAAFAVPGMVTMGVGLACARAWRRGHLAPPDPESSGPEPTAPGTNEAIDPAHTAWSRPDGANMSELTDTPTGRSTRRAFLRTVMVIGVLTVLGGFVFQSTTFALPAILDERLADLGGTSTRVGVWTFLVFALAATAQLVVGHLVDRYAIAPVLIGVVMLQALLFALMVPMEGAMALIVAGAFMLLVFGQIPIVDVLVGRIARPEWRSRAFAISYAGGFTVTAAAVPVVAALHSVGGFRRLFIVLAVMAAAMGAAALLLPRQSARRGVSSLTATPVRRKGTSPA